MPTSQLMKKCVQCNKMTMHYQEKPNYVLHLLLSFVTVGIWLLVWLLFINAKDPQCSVCGRSNDFLGNFLYRQKNNIDKISNDKDSKKSIKKNLGYKFGRYVKKNLKKNK
jgi:hypothetical protein